MPQTKKETLLSAIFQQLEIAAFELYKEECFVALFPPPAWFDEVFEKKMGSKKPTNEFYCLGKMFPFVDNFLYDANQIWDQENDNNLRSGLWAEVIDYTPDIASKDGLTAARRPEDTRGTWEKGVYATYTLAGIVSPNKKPPSLIDGGFFASMPECSEGASPFRTRVIGDRMVASPALPD